jgi:hypothetical protein
MVDQEPGHRNERLRLILAATLMVAALAAFVWGGITDVAAHYVGCGLLLLAASVGGYGAISGRIAGASMKARR